MIRQMTLRQVPDEVGKGLRAKARKSGRSINRVTIELLEEALGVRPSGSRKRDLSALEGRWSREETAAFERHTKTFGKIDAEVWSA